MDDFLRFRLSLDLPEEDRPDLPTCACREDALPCTRYYQKKRLRMAGSERNLRGSKALQALKACRRRPTASPSVHSARSIPAHIVALQSVRKFNAFEEFVSAQIRCRSEEACDLH